MLLNHLEKALMNNPVRAAIQRRVEARQLLRLGGRMRGGAALEVGAGRGVGVELILDVFGADRVDAFDLDPQMIELATRRLSGRGPRVRLWTGDVEAIAAADASYDAVFDFGIIHHVPHWRAALREIVRVLKPGGRLYAEEALARFISRPSMRRLLTHPEEDRFDHEAFCRGLEDAGLRVTASSHILGWFGWYVAEKPAAG